MTVGVGRFLGLVAIGIVTAFLASQSQSGCAESVEPWFPGDVAPEYGRDDAGGRDDAAGDDATGDDRGGDDGAHDDATATDDGARDDGTTDTGTCPESPCRLRPSCGCADGEKCSLDFAELSAGNVVKLCREAGSNDASDTCTADTDCRAGTVCSQLVGVGSTGTAMCYDFCNSQSDCSGAGSLCVQLSTAPTPGTCSHSCNPMTNSGCPSGTACKPFSLTSTGDSLTDCGADVGSGGHGAYCADDTGCRAGTICMDADGDTYGDTCLSICNNVGGMCSSTGTDCVGFTTPFIVGGTEYGVCSP